MKKICKQIITIVILCILILVLAPNKIQAVGSFSINKSSTSLNTGDVTTVTITASGCAGQFSITSSNTSVATVSTSSVWLDDSSSSVTITTKSAGSAVITITATDVTDTELNDVTGNRTCTITVTEPAPETVPEPISQPKPETQQQQTTTPQQTTKPKNNTPQPTKSSNSDLATLQIAEGVISPEFNYKTKEYAITVPNDVTKLSISAIADSAKATVNIDGNEELQVGENTIEIIVKAEDGTKTIYTIIATRAEEELSLKEISAYYIDENNEKVILKLTPEFIFNTYEYNLNKLPYSVENIEVEVLANKENANIQIIGNTALKSGKNEITIIVEAIDEESGLNEQKKYTLIVEKEEEPIMPIVTPIQKIKNWLNFDGIYGWIKENYNKIIIGMLFVATTAFVGLTIYFAIDYKKYQELLAKLANYNKANLMERANAALKPKQNSIENDVTNINKLENTEIEESMKEENTEEIIEPETAELCAEIEEARARMKKGKRYR